MKPHDLWRTRLDPRDPDYLGPEDDDVTEDERDTVEFAQDDLARAASEAESSWRPTT